MEGAIEGYYPRQIRKDTKSKGAFPSDEALIKLVWLASQRIAKKWTSPLRGWRQTVQQLKIHFGDRIQWAPCKCIVLSATGCPALPECWEVPYL